MLEILRFDQNVRYRSYIVRLAYIIEIYNRSRVV